MGGRCGDSAGRVPGFRGMTVGVSRGDSEMLPHTISHHLCGGRDLHSLDVCHWGGDLAVVRATLLGLRTGVTPPPPPGTSSFISRGALFTPPRPVPELLATLKCPLGASALPTHFLLLIAEAELSMAACRINTRACGASFQQAMRTPLTVTLRDRLGSLTSSELPAPLPALQVWKITGVEGEEPRRCSWGALAWNSEGLELESCAFTECPGLSY